MPLRLIVGLGNPGEQYRNTRHNAGFMTLDLLADKMGACWKKDRHHRALVTGASGVLLAKPQTFMNDSGECVGALSRYFKIAPAELLVVYDDIALPLGTLRLREGGSAGGHNGMKSIIAHLGTDRFPRLRVGIGSHGSGSLIGHVLGSFPPEQQETLQDALSRAVDGIGICFTRGFQAAANIVNRPQKKPEQSPQEADAQQTSPDLQQTREFPTS